MIGQMGQEDRILLPIFLTLHFAVLLVRAPGMIGNAVNGFERR